MQQILESRRTVLLIAVLLIAALLGAQLMATRNAPASGVASTGRAIGRAGFAYLSGLRTFAAAVLWNRLEPQFHDYYAGRALKDQTFLLPTMYVVQELDPQFVQVYYNAAFLLAQRGSWDEAYQVAEEGIANNPRSGLMRANYVQLLLYQDKEANQAKALEQSTIGLGPDIVYANPDDEFESLGVFRVPFRRAGREDVVTAIDQRQAELRAQGGTPTGLQHDHDGDGSPDH